MQKVVKRSQRLRRLLCLGALALAGQMNQSAAHADAFGPALNIYNPPANDAVYTLKASEGLQTYGAVQDLDGINRVTVIIRRYSDGAYWTGNNWQYASAAQAALVGYSSPNVYDWALPNGPPHAALPPGTYLLQVEAVDGVGNRTQQSRNFYGSGP